MTATGSPEGCHSRPLLAYSPTSSFSFVSTLITGFPAARNSPAVALMRSNWATWPPSSYSPGTPWQTGPSPTAPRLRRPPQRRARITTVSGETSSSNANDTRLRNLNRRTSRPRRTHPPVRLRTSADLVHPRTARSCARHPTDRLGLRAKQQPPPLLVQQGPDHREPLGKCFLSHHTQTTSESTIESRPCDSTTEPKSVCRLVVEGCAGAGLFVAQCVPG
ncbi:MAG: hypothetical protein QOE61_5158 [Micromonosporaceae bacterium]|nr:hypothetical protein [Micromonosporaceae bacterium]